MSSILAERFRNYRSAHEDATLTGPGNETREERADRLHRERTEQALVDSADASADYRYRESHPQPPSQEMLAIAEAQIAKINKMIATGQIKSTTPAGERD